MNNVERATNRPSFFPNSKSSKTKKSLKPITTHLKRNSSVRRDELEKMSKKDAKVTIPAAVRDFSRIKKAVDKAPLIDNSKKITDLKARIGDGTYKFDYEALADKLLQEELS